MKVALKYCGGCDPTFDRVAYFQRIAAAAGGRITWTTREQGDQQAVLIICGCATTCPSEELSLGPETLLLKDEHLAPAEVVVRLLDKEEQHG